jgi:hypothetical protein
MQYKTYPEVKEERLYRNHYKPFSDYFSEEYRKKWGGDDFKNSRLIKANYSKG